MPRDQLPIESDEIELLPVLPDQRALAACEIDREHVRRPRVAIVHRHRDLAGNGIRPVRRQRTHLRKRGQVAQFIGPGIDHEEMEVLVAVLVEHEHDVAAVRRPILPSDRAALGPRHRAAVGDMIDRRHPDVKDAIDWRQP